MGWVKAHTKENKPPTNRNKKVDELNKMRKIKIGSSLNPKWFQLGEWLHQKLGLKRHLTSLHRAKVGFVKVFLKNVSNVD